MTAKKSTTKKRAPKAPKIPPALVLKCVRADMTSRDGFKWPSKGKVQALDWDPAPVCGQGLHGWLDGEGDPTACDWVLLPTAKWLILKVDPATIIDLAGKVKFPGATVIACGDRATICARLSVLRPGKRVIFGTATGGDGSTLTGGYRSTLTGGYDSTLTGGEGSTLTGGEGSTLTGGPYSTLILSRWDRSASRKRLFVFYVGENGALPNVPYRLGADDKLEQVTK